MPRNSLRRARTGPVSSLPITRGLVLTLGLGLLTLAAPNASLAEPVVGFVASVRGKVDLRHANESIWLPAKRDGEISVGDTLRTGLDAGVKVVLVDDTILGLGEDTELQIDNFVIGPEALTQASVLQHVRGQLRTRVGEAFGGTTRIEIHTPTAIMGVKGTEGTTRIDGGPGASAGEEQEVSTLIRNWEGGITAAMVGGAAVPVPPGQCRVVYLGRVGLPSRCPDDFIPVSFEPPIGLVPAKPESELVFGETLPAVSAAFGDGGGVREVVGESLLIEPPDPVIEDRADADTISGIVIDPLADLDFGGGEVDSDPDPLSNLNFGVGEVGSDSD